MNPKSVDATVVKEIQRILDHLPSATHLNICKLMTHVDDPTTETHFIEISAVNSSPVILFYGSDLTVLPQEPLEEILQELQCLDPSF